MALTFLPVGELFCAGSTASMRFTEEFMVSLTDPLEVPITPSSTYSTSLALTPNRSSTLSPASFFPQQSWSKMLAKETQVSVRPQVGSRDRPTERMKMVTKALQAFDMVHPPFLYLHTHQIRTCKMPPSATLATRSRSS